MTISILKNDEFQAEALTRTVIANDIDKLYKTRLLISIIVFYIVLAKPEKRPETRGIITKKGKIKLLSLVKDITRVFKSPKN